jgi:hypothetical protein
MSEFPGYELCRLCFSSQGRPCVARVASGFPNFLDSYIWKMHQQETPKQRRNCIRTLLVKCLVTRQISYSPAQLPYVLLRCFQPPIHLSQPTYTRVVLMKPPACQRRSPALVLSFRDPTSGNPSVSLHLPDTPISIHMEHPYHLRLTSPKSVDS